ncbi:MAG: hypothetical protein ACREAU_00785 [Nitrosopumilaceae archaeon]
MANLNLGGPGSPIIIHALPQPSIDRIKVFQGPNNTSGSVPLDLNNPQIEGNLTLNTVQIVRRFIQEYRLLIDALASGQIDNTKFTEIYNETKSQGIQYLPQLVRDIIQYPQTLQKINTRPPPTDQMPTIEGSHIIRGARIIQQILTEESTYNELERKTRAFRPLTRRRQFATDPIQIVNLDITPYIGTKMLLFRGTANNQGRKYKTTVGFSKVTFEKENTDSNVTFKASDGQDYNIIPIKLGVNNVRVRCQCLDFYYRFGGFDYTDKSLYGRAPKPYVRKTPPPPIGRPFVNPMKTPGVCKHIMKTIKALLDSGMVVR